MVPQRCLTWALAMSVNPWVLASNHWSILVCEVMFWSMSRASYLKSKTAHQTGVTPL